MFHRLRLDPIRTSQDQGATSCDIHPARSARPFSTSPTSLAETHTSCRMYSRAGTTTCVKEKREETNATRTRTSRRNDHSLHESMDEEGKLTLRSGTIGLPDDRGEKTRERETLTTTTVLLGPVYGGGGGGLSTGTSQPCERGLPRPSTRAGRTALGRQEAARLLRPRSLRSRRSHGLRSRSPCRRGPLSSL